MYKSVPDVTFIRTYVHMYDYLPVTSHVSIVVPPLLEPNTHAIDGKSIHN